MSDVEVVSPQEIEPAGDGLDKIISGAMEEHHYGDEPAPKAEKTEAEEKTAEQLKIDATGRAHAADGKFAPKTEKISAEPEATAKAVPAEGEAKPAEATQQPVEIQPIAAPERWSPEDKAKFAKLPREAQEIVAERYKGMEADYTRKTQEVAETRKSIEPVIGEFQRLDPLLRHMGMTPQQFVVESANVATNLLSGDPSQRANAIAYLVQHRGVPIPDLLNALGIPLPQADGSGPDPAYLQLHQKFTGLEQQLRQMGEQSKLAETQRAQAEFDALGQAKDDSGQLKFPHFGRVSQTMIQLVATNQADTWDSAYSKAVRLDDELFKQTVEAERNRVSAEAEKARLEAVEKAKKASAVKTSSGSPKGAREVKGLDALIDGALEAHGIN
jgi:hypothetical protein